jgi:serine phosphatase RsbU (regulator of sigma subunit)
MNRLGLGRPFASLSLPLGTLLFVVLCLGVTVWHAHVTLERGATVQQLLRDAQFQRTRLTAIQVGADSGLRGYLLTGDRRFLDPFGPARPSWQQTAAVVGGDLRQLNVPLGELDALQRIHDDWQRTVAQPLLQDPHRANAHALLYSGKGLNDAFSADQVTFRTVIDAAGRAADEQLRASIDTTVGAGAVASVAVLLIGLLFTGYQARSAQRFHEVNVLYQNEKRLSDSLQEAFLQKRLPAVPGIDLHGKYVPAASERRVGGDWYDAFELPDGRLMFSIGDVAGHGVAAAVVMNRARQAILAAALHESDPALVLQRANATILLQEDGVMVTALCGFIDPGNREVVYATAGHPAPMLAHAGKPPAFLPHDGVPLGVFPESAYRRFVAQAQPGDVLVLYTDGMIEHGHDIVAGEARLIEAAVHAVDAENPAGALFEAIFGSDAPADDVAVLAVSFRTA